MALVFIYLFIYLLSIIYTYTIFIKTADFCRYQVIQQPINRFVIVEH